MLEFPQSLGFDLPDALARHRELLADLFQSVVGIHLNPEAHSQHAFRMRGQRESAPSNAFASSRWLDTAAACFDCCLSQESLDGVNGWLTT